MQSARHLRSLEIGRRLDGRPFTIPAPGRLPHILIGGETGSGKSGVTASMGAEFARCPDVAVVGIDLKLMELALWRPRLTCLANTADEASMLLALVVAEMCRRNELLQAHGLRMWQPRFGPWIVLVVDELARLAGVDVEHLLRQAQASTETDERTGGPKKLDRDLVRTAKDALAVRMSLIDWIAAVGRAAGITLVTATQYPTAEVIDPSIRSQLGLRFMLRVISREQVGVILGAGNEQHITPDSIPVSERGGFWCVGNPGDPRAIRGRAFLFNDTTLANRFRATSHLRIDQGEVFKADPAPHLEHQPESQPAEERAASVVVRPGKEQTAPENSPIENPQQERPAMDTPRTTNNQRPPLHVVPDEITPDPYPERPTADQGVRQRDHHQPHGDWKFKTAGHDSGLVVHRPPAASGRVMTTRVSGIADRPLAASRSIRVSIGSAPVTWFAVGLSVFAQTIVTLALVLFDADPMTAAFISVAMLVCSLLLIAAEQITGRSGR